MLEILIAVFNADEDEEDGVGYTFIKTGKFPCIPNVEDSIYVNDMCIRINAREFNSDTGSVILLLDTEQFHEVLDFRGDWWHGHRKETRELLAKEGWKRITDDEFSVLVHGK